jgi:hypothetical protein
VKSLFKRKPVSPGTAVPPHNPGPCLNCGAYLWGNDLFCPKCGQKRLERDDMKFSRMISESFLDYFHFDSGFFKTIFQLVFKPGLLTMEYMEGKRKSYVEPFRLFLVISIIYFLLLPLTRDSVNDHAGVNSTTSSNRPGKTAEGKPYKFSLRGMQLTAARQDSIRKEIDTIGLNKYVDKNFADENWAIRLMLKHAFKIIVYSGQSFRKVLEHTASKLIFLLIPFIALLLKLLYFRSKRLYYEHLIFSLHLHAFVFLVLVVVLLLDFFIPVDPLIVVLISLSYLLFALKKNYTEKIGKTLGKFFLLLLFYCIIALPVFFFLLILVSIFMV